MPDEDPKQKPNSKPNGKPDVKPSVMKPDEKPVLPSVNDNDIEKHAERPGKTRNKT